MATPKLPAGRAYGQPPSSLTADGPVAPATDQQPVLLEQPGELERAVPPRDDLPEAFAAELGRLSLILLTRARTLAGVRAQVALLARFDG